MPVAYVTRRYHPSRIRPKVDIASLGQEIQQHILLATNGRIAYQLQPYGEDNRRAKPYNVCRGGSCEDVPHLRYHLDEDAIAVIQALEAEHL